MTELELTLAIFMMECVFLFGLTIVMTAAYFWRRRRQEIHIAAMLVRQIKGQEILTIEKIRMILSKNSTLEFNQLEALAKKITAQQQLLLADVADIFLCRDKQKLYALPEKLNVYSHLLLGVNKSEPELPLHADFSESERAKLALQPMVAD